MTSIRRPRSAGSKASMQRAAFPAAVPVSLTLRMLSIS